MALPQRSEKREAKRKRNEAKREKRKGSEKKRKEDAARSESVTTRSWSAITLLLAPCFPVATSRWRPCGAIRPGRRRASPRRPYACWGGAGRPGPPGRGSRP